jgi:hypothetical protein
MTRIFAMILQSFEIQYLKKIKNNSKKISLCYSNVHDLNSNKHYTVYTVHCDTTTRVTTKGKAVPLQAWSGPEGSRKLRFPHHMTTARDGGKVVSLTYRPTITPGNVPGTHFC